MKKIDSEQTESSIEIRKTLRKALRSKRNALSPELQRAASHAIAETLLSLTKPNDVVALYLANDGEISPNLAITELQNQQRVCLLPVMHSFRKGYLNFQRFMPDTVMTPNSFDILEPKLNAADTFALQDIDYIFMPLVGFDDQGNRMGMGGGFYDRTLSHLNSLPSSPKLVGLAHDCQQVEQLPIQSWDVPIDLIITPSKKITPNR